MPRSALPGAVSLVLPTFNRLRALRANLDALCALAAVDELIVVDDGSTDGTWSWLDSRCERRLRLLRHRTNRGSPSARNTGAAAALGEWVLFVEDDCRFPADYARVLHRAAVRHRAHVVGAPMVHPGAEDVVASVAAARAARTGDNGLDGVAGFPPEPALTPLLPAPSLVHHSVFAELSFDPGYRGNAYREETDFFVSAVRRGYRCLLTPETYFWEPARFRGGQPRSLAAQWWTVRNNWRFLRRHGGWLTEAGLISSPLQEQLSFTARRLRLVTS